MAPTGIKLPDIRINRALMRGIFWLLLFLFLATMLTSARGIYDRINSRAELRYKVETSFTEVSTPDEMWTERLVRLRNGGNGDAQNVYFTVLLPGQNLTRWRVISSEPYTAQPMEGTHDTLALSMERLASGAEINLLIWASHPVQAQPVPPVVSAAFDGGIAESSERMTSFEEFRAVGDVLARGLRQIVGRLGQQIGATDVGGAMADQLSDLGVQDFDPTGLSGREFSEALIGAAVLVFAAWLFLSREVAGVVTAIVVGLLLWLYSDASVHVQWLAWSVIVAAIFTLLLLVGLAVFQGISWRQISILLLSAMAAYIILSQSGVSVWCVLERGNACGDTRVAAGIVLIFWMIIVDFLIRVFWRGSGKAVFILR